jgi:hypothetical protein
VDVGCTLGSTPQAKEGMHGAGHAQLDQLAHVAKLGGYSACELARIYPTVASHLTSRSQALAMNAEKSSCGAAGHHCERPGWVI